MATVLLMLLKVFEFVQLKRLMMSFMTMIVFMIMYMITIMMMIVKTTR